jgi:hypothetical protein
MAYKICVMFRFESLIKKMRWRTTPQKGVRPLCDQ